MLLNIQAVLKDLVCVSTGVGDGLYPVYANIEEVPGWGEHVLRRSR